MDLQVLLGPLDSSHVPIDPGRILHVERSDRAAAHAAAELGLSVQFEPGEVREAVYQVGAEDRNTAGQLNHPGNLCNWCK